MLFLITKKQKNKILDEYYARLINLVTIGLVLLFVIFLVSLFPSYLTMSVDSNIVKDKISPLQSEIELYKAQAEKNNISGINNEISILNLNTQKQSVEIYKEIKNIYQKIPNVKILSINVDTLSKQIIVVADIDGKDTANTIVEKLNTTRYKGADLPYSVFSQSQNFIFSQTLNYE